LGGEQLKKAFKLPAGPWIGRAQAVLLEAVMDGQLPVPEALGAEHAAIEYLELRREDWQSRPGEPGAASPAQSK
jgi:hypothetical protein